MTLLFFGTYMAVSKISTPEKVINTILSSTGEAKSIVVTDATTVSAATPINNVKELVGPRQASTITKILGKANKLLGSDIIRMTAPLLPAIADPKAALGRLKEFNKQGVKNVTQYLDQVGGKLAEQALSNVGFIDGNKAILDGILGAKRDKPLSEIWKYNKDMVEMSIGGSKQMIKDAKNWDPKSMADVANLINTITGDKKLATVLDLGTEFAMLKALNDTALDMGLYGIADIIIKDRKDRKERRTLLLDGLPKAVSNSDLGYIELTLKETSKGAVFARVPNIITDLLKSFKLPDGIFYPRMTDYRALIAILDKLSGNWRYSSEFKHRVYNLDLFRQANDVTKRTFALDPELAGPVNIAGSYMPLECRTAFKVAYPFY